MQLAGCCWGVDSGHQYKANAASSHATSYQRPLPKNICKGTGVTQRLRAEQGHDLQKLFPGITPAPDSSSNLHCSRLDSALFIGVKILHHCKQPLLHCLCSQVPKRSDSKKWPGKRAGSAGWAWQCNLEIQESWISVCCWFNFSVSEKWRISSADMQETENWGLNVRDCWIGGTGGARVCLSSWLTAVFHHMWSLGPAGGPLKAEGCLQVGCE